MEQSSTPPAPDGSPWMVLLLDKSRDDPKWILCVVLQADDVTTATLDATGRYESWPEATTWVKTRLRRDVTLSPLAHALAWRIEDRRPKP